MNLIPLRQIEHPAVALALCPCGGRRTYLQTEKAWFCERCGLKTNLASITDIKPEQNQNKEHIS